MDQNWTGLGTDRNRTYGRTDRLVNPWFEQWLTNTHFRVLVLKFSRWNDNGWPWKGPIRFCLVVTALQLHLGTLVATVSVRTVYNSMFSCVVFLLFEKISYRRACIGTVSRHCESCNAHGHDSTFLMKTHRRPPDMCRCHWSLLKSSLFSVRRDPRNVPSKLVWTGPRTTQI